MNLTPDMLNGVFEFCGAVALSINVRKLWRDKMIKGVHWASTAFFTSWSLFNLFYYPSLHQWFSLAGGSCLVLTNLTWLALVIRYWKRSHAPVVAE